MSSNNINMNFWIVQKSTMKFNLLKAESKKNEPFFIENSRQSTLPINSVHHLTWRSSGLLFNDIITDRIDVIHRFRSSSSESKVFAVFMLNFKKEFSTNSTSSSGSMMM